MSTASALFSLPQSRLFEWLFGQPSRAYHINELLRLTGLGSATLQRELKRLLGAGLVLDERLGNLRRVRANPESPIYGELVALVEKSLGIGAAIRAALDGVGEKIALAFIFGSIAKRSDTASSDIDILLVSSELSVAEALDHLLPLEPRLGRKINVTRLTPEEYAARQTQPDSFVNRVLAQPIIKLVGHPHAIV